MSSEQAQLVASFESLQQSHASLQHENDKMRARLEARDRERQDAQELIAHQNEQALQSIATRAREHAILEKYVAMVAVHSDTTALAACETATSDQLAAARNENISLQRRLQVFEEERLMMRARLEEVTQLHSDKARLEHELFLARSEERKARAELAPAQTTADMWKGKFHEMRGMLGKSEVEAKRKEMEFQTQLSTMSRQLQVTKSRADRLFLEYDQRQRSLPPHPQHGQMTRTSGQLPPQQFSRGGQMGAAWNPHEPHYQRPGEPQRGAFRFGYP